MAAVVRLLAYATYTTLELELRIKIGKVIGLMAYGGGTYASRCFHGRSRLLDIGEHRTTKLLLLRCYSRHTARCHVTGVLFPA